MKKRMLYGSAAVAALVTFSIMRPFTGLSRDGMSAIGLLLAALLMWVGETLPMSITTILLICILPIMNIMPFNDAVSNIGTNTMLFIIASSGLTVAITLSSLPQRMTNAIIHLVKNHGNLMVIGLGVAVTICSAFMSSLATCFLFFGIVKAMLKDEKSKLAKDLMIAIPACAGIGGFMSPAGTPANVLLLQILEENGYSLTFAEWCKIGFPMGLLAVIIFLASLLLINRPESPLTVIQVPEETAPMDSRDYKTLIIVLVVIICWFLSSWIKQINTTMIAVVGLTSMFLPGVLVLDWKQFSDGVNWDLVLTMGTVSVVMSGISKTGLMQWFAQGVFSFIASLPPFALMVCLSMTICLLRAFIPTTTAVITLLAPMLIYIAPMTGQDISALLMILAFWTASALLLCYTEPIFLITLDSKAYTATDLLKAGIIPCLLLSVATEVIIPALM